MPITSNDTPVDAALIARAASSFEKSLTWSGWPLQARRKVHGMKISIENKKGSVRRGTDKDGHKWAVKMHADYGYIRGTVGKDKDHLDCYVGPDPQSRRVFIIHQNDPTTGKYDEDKVMLGFTSAPYAKEIYLKQYDRPGFFGSMEEVDIDTFKEKVMDKKNHGKKLVIKKSLQRMLGVDPELVVGIKVEMEHTDNPEEARKIALDHLAENPHYYSELVEAGLVDEPEALAVAERLVRLKKSGHKKTVAIDFDGVINSYTSGWKGPAETDAPVPGAALAINKLVDRGYKVIIYSTRAGEPEGAKAIIQYLSDIEVEPQGIEVTDKKPIADVYIDDRAMTFDGDWPAMMERIEKFKPWMEKSIRLVIPLLEKARKSPRLVPVKRTVTRGNSTFTMTVWMLPADAKKMESGGAQQFDLFDPPPMGAFQYDLFEPPEEKAPEPAGVPDAKKELQEIKKVVAETESSDDKDRAVARAINLATPETRSLVLEAITADEEPKPEPEPSYEYKPGVATVYMGSLGQKDVPDYTGVIPKKIGVFPASKVLGMEPPSWMLPVDQGFFRSESGRLPFIKIGDNRYIVQVNGKGSGMYASGAAYVLASVDVLAATNDFFAKRQKELTKKLIADDLAKTKADSEAWLRDNPKVDGENAYQRNTRYYHERVVAGNYRSSHKPFRMMADNKMTWTQLGLIQAVTMNNSRNKAWEFFHSMVAEMKQKTSDMEIQLEDHQSSFGKGRETAYGNKGTKNDLLASHGVKVKRQNGDEISPQEVEEIKKALDGVYSVFGNRSSMARKYGLKISHSGDKLMHARKALGIYSPFHRAIGVTAQLGDTHMGFILAHEWAHFMDNYLGGTMYHYASDEQGSSADRIASAFRSAMIQKQKSDYQNRTCECFARAMEEYFSIKTGDSAALQEYRSGQGNYVEPDNFKEQIAPLIDGFLAEKADLLKSMVVRFFKR